MLSDLNEASECVTVMVTIIINILNPISQRLRMGNQNDLYQNNVKNNVTKTGNENGQATTTFTGLNIIKY